MLLPNMGQAKDKHGGRKSLAKVLQHLISSRWLFPWINCRIALRDRGCYCLWAGGRSHAFLDLQQVSNWRDREREREISNQNIGKPSLQSLHERHKDSCTHCSLGGSWQKPWLGDLWAGDLCSRGWTLQGSAIAMKCFNFPQFCILQCLTMSYNVLQCLTMSYNVLQCLTARSWLPTSNLLRALRPCWYNGLEPVGTGKTVRLSQKSFEIWYFNIRLEIS